MKILMKILTLSLIITCNNVAVKATNKKELLHQTKFPLCKACKTFVDSFKRGMERTKRGKFEGGDTAWEEEKLGSYAQSEVRLVEIQEKICSDVEEGRDQCYSMHEHYDDQIEEWWFKLQNDKPDLFTHFCIETVKQCCPENHFGPDCEPCPGYPDNICNKNGKCRGSGTRKGNGSCICENDYTGNFCDQCSDNYYESYRDQEKFICSKCHHSCSGGCTGASAKSCKACTNGYFQDEEKGCLDVNECVGPKPACGPLQFCINNEGSFRCVECDRACAGCMGEGPDSCINCASGYVLLDNICVDTEVQGRQQHVLITRYLTYLGLCIATCIIFQRSVALAALIGLCVAVYISISEYILNTPPTPSFNTSDLAEKLGAQIAN